jgi:hypothetical protein
MITYLNINMHAYISWSPAHLTKQILHSCPCRRPCGMSNYALRICDIDQVAICERVSHDASTAGGIASWVTAGRWRVFYVC